jgi:DNA polymerase-1
MMIALIDMDLVVYRCAASAESEHVDVAYSRMEDLLDNIIQKVHASSYRAFLTGKGNFRKDIYPEYKANRTQEKPVHLQACREYACEKMNAEVTQDKLEADDYLGIYQTDSTTICSLDKDLLQIAGNHYQWAIAGANWEKPDNWIYQSELEGLRLFYEQCLKGDTSDNVKGVAGIGEAKAKKYLQDCKTEQEMLAVVLEKYPHEDEFLMNAQCLWVLREKEGFYTKRYERLKNEHGKVLEVSKEVDKAA